jgi:hypothetical protein
MSYDARSVESDFTILFHSISLDRVGEVANSIRMQTELIVFMDSISVPPNGPLHLRRETNVVLETLLFASKRTPQSSEVPNPDAPNAASGAAAG